MLEISPTQAELREIASQLPEQIPDLEMLILFGSRACGIITAELAGVLSQSGVLRNRLVHLYDKLEPVKVHQAIAFVLQNYPIYQRQIAAYLNFLQNNSK